MAFGLNVGMAFQVLVSIFTATTNHLRSFVYGRSPSRSVPTYIRDEPVEKDMRCLCSLPCTQFYAYGWKLRTVTWTSLVM